MDEFKLGDKVKDKITGFAGVVVGKHSWLYGCTTYSVKPQALDKDGKPCETVSFDGAGLEYVKEALTPIPVTTGGPAPYVAPVVR